MIKIVVLQNNQQIIADVEAYQDKETGLPIAFTARKPFIIVYSQSEEGEVMANLVRFVPASTSELFEFDWSAKLTFGDPSPQLEQSYLELTTEAQQLQLFDTDEYGEAQAVEAEIVEEPFVEFDDASGIE